MSPTQGLLLFTAVKTRKSMTKNQRKAGRHGTVKDETAKKLLKAKFVQDGWYLRGVHQDETVTRITDEHCGMTKNASACGVHACLDLLFTVELSSGRALRHSFEIPAPFWCAAYKDAPFPLAVAGAIPGDIEQTWRPYPTQYGAQAAMGAWLAEADFSSIAVISRDDNVIVHAVPHHAELGAYIFEKARAVAEKSREAQLERFIKTYKKDLVKFEITPSDHAPPGGSPRQPKQKPGKRKRNTKKKKTKKKTKKRVKRKRAEKKKDQDEVMAAQKKEDEDEDEDDGQKKKKGKLICRPRKLPLQAAIKQGDGRETQRLEILKRLSAYYDDLFCASKMVLNVILNEAKSPYHVIGAVMETTKSARSFISNITRGSEVFQKYMSNAHHCNINLIAFSHTFPSFECAPVIANEVKYIGNRIRANIRNTVKFNSERALLKMKKILSSMSRRLMFQKLVSHEPSLKI